MRGVHVDQHLAAGALIPHWFGPRENVSRVEVAFRDNLDLFIERVDYINDMLKVKLLKFEDIAPYVKYWIERIADPYASLQPDLKRSLWIFIDAYEYHGVQELSRRFGYSIKPSTKDIAALKQEIAEGKWGDAKNTEQTSPAA